MKVWLVQVIEKILILSFRFSFLSWKHTMPSSSGPLWAAKYSLPLLLRMHLQVLSIWSVIMQCPHASLPIRTNVPKDKAHLNGFLHWDCGTKNPKHLSKHTVITHSQKAHAILFCYFFALKIADKGRAGRRNRLSFSNCLCGTFCVEFTSLLKATDFPIQFTKFR